MNYKVKTVRTSNYGDREWVFVGPDGKAHRFPIVGRIWKIRAEGTAPGPFKWSTRQTVVETPEGLAVVGPRTTRPLTLAEGEVYLPITVTGRKLAFVELPTVGDAEVVR